MPNSWPLTWRAPTAVGWPCSTPPAKNSSGVTATPSVRVRSGCRCSICWGRWDSVQWCCTSVPVCSYPRPETESILEWATAQSLSGQPCIVDVCTGSGALAVALARHWPVARIIGIDDSDVALDYARRNAEGTGVELVRADIGTPGLLAELDAQVDLLVANPPYVPDDAVLDPEVAQHDPPHAVFGGPDGMAVIPAVVALAGRWLRPGGLFAVEHDDTTSAATIE